MIHVRVAVAAAAVALVLLTGPVPAQSIRDRIRLSPDKLTPISEQQANELTLTLNHAAVRPIQVWVRTAGTVGTDGRTITATAPAHEAPFVKTGQRVRAFPPESRSSMFQARVASVTHGTAGTRVTVALSGPAYPGSTRYILEIVTEPMEFLSVPNEAIIESEGRHVVYVEASRGRYVPTEISPGLQGELFTQVLGGLEPGAQVVTFGSFFIDADNRLKSP